ncbi:MAG: methyltransferase domain-containing protein [Candidatus Polarisedimenticolia bacterium]
MAKKARFESAKYHFLRAVDRLRHGADAETSGRLARAVESVRFENPGSRLRVIWSRPEAGALECDLTAARLYVRGDSEKTARLQQRDGDASGRDAVQEGNERLFDALALEFGRRVSGRQDLDRRHAGHAEERFHDAWAGSAEADAIDVRRANEACTAPELRYIHARLGDVRDLRVLDLGCGLGEASAYFALRGARVTAVDLSSGMLELTRAVARRYGVSVATHQAGRHGIGLPPGASFDVIYAGNLLHHVDIGRTLAELKGLLAPGGRLVTWDPLAYNPIINVYRARATGVRTPDEHPLTWNDLALFKRHFPRVERRYFWLASLAIFLVMAVVQRRDPNRERYWKVILDEADRWRPLYVPLERLDRALLALFPPLRLLCWNVVVIAGH